MSSNTITSIALFLQMWYFKRMNVPTHLPQLLFQSKSLQFEGMHIDSPQCSDVLLHVVWDNPKLHDTRVNPMYKLWKESGM